MENGYKITSILMHAHALCTTRASGMTNAQNRRDLHNRVERLSTLIANGETARIFDLGILLGRAGADWAPIPAPVAED